MDYFFYQDGANVFELYEGLHKAKESNPEAVKELNKAIKHIEKTHSETIKEKKEMWEEVSGTINREELGQFIN